MTAEIVMLYQQGMTQQEIAVKLGTTQKVVFSRLRKAGFKCRKAAIRFQRGSANKNWKGNGAGYQAFHRRLDSVNGRPRKCEVCGTTDSERKYDWANLSGRYDDPSDYKRMCRSCHWKHDGTHKNFKGAVGARAKGVVSSARR